MINTRMPKFRNGIHHILYDFSSWTSTHGVSHIAQADKILIGLFWITVTVAAAIIMVYLIANSVIRFLNYEVTMTQRSIIDKQEFPAVTICNGSPWKSTNVTGTPLEGLIEAYQAGHTNSTYGFTMPFEMTESLRATRWTRFMYEDLRALDEDEGYDISFKFREMLINCEYNQLPCDLDGTVTEFYDAYNGLCHMVNANMSWVSTRAGPYNGMRISFKSPAGSYLPWVQTSGVVFYIHGTDETPFQDAFGYFAQVGKCTSVGVKSLERIKLPPPYTDCSDDGNGASNYYYNDYEVEACLRSCLQDSIIEKCLCYDPQYNYPYNVTVPSCYKMDDINAAMDCADAIINELDETTNSSITQCDCPYGCDQSYYLIAMSQAKYPANTYIPPECGNKSANWDNRTDCISWYKENTLMLEIYLERTSYQSNLESAGYTWTNMIADIGGQLGLWLGMSVISLFEFGALAAILVLYAIVRPETISIKNYDYFKEFDKQIAEHGSSLIYRSQNKDHDMLHDVDIAPPKVVDAQPTPSMTF